MDQISSKGNPQSRVMEDWTQQLGGFGTGKSGMSFGEIRRSLDGYD